MVAVVVNACCGRHLQTTKPLNCFQTTSKRQTTDWLTCVCISRCAVDAVQHAAPHMHVVIYARQGVTAEQLMQDANSRFNVRLKRPIEVSRIRRMFQCSIVPIYLLKSKSCMIITYRPTRHLLACTAPLDKGWFIDQSPPC